MLTVETETGVGFAPEILEALRSRGFEVEEVSRSGAFGRVHAVRWHPDTREWEGGADPDWEGAVAKPREMIR
jgi:gamma-glutamyltranspeptidase